MTRERRKVFLAIAGAALLVLLALGFTGRLPLISRSLRTLITQAIFTSTVAAPYWYNVIGATYAPYPGQTSCYNYMGDSCGNTSNCDGNPIFGALDVQKQNGSAGSTAWVYQSGSNPQSGSIVVGTYNEADYLDYSCTPGRAISGEHEECHYQLCGKLFCRTCGCYGGPDSSQTFSTNATVYDNNGATIVNDSGSLYGTLTIQPGGNTPGTYTAGQTVYYTLYCNGVGVPARVPVTMGATSAVLSLSATPTLVKQGIDTTQVHATAASVMNNSCAITTQDGTTVKTYTGTSVDDTFTYGPLAATTTLTLNCVGTEGFKASAQTTINVFPSPILSITANNTPYQLMIAPNTSADIRWSSQEQKANSCSVTYSAAAGTCLATGKSISTSGAYNWKGFTIGTDNYLAVANAYNGSTYHINSNIYKWTSSKSCFGNGVSTCGSPFQQIATDGAAKWEFFTIGTDNYLAVANSRNDSTRVVNSKIYKWMSGSSCFGDGTTCGAAYQSIATKGAVDIKALAYNNTTYLGVANYRDDTSYAVNSYIFVWMNSGASCPAGGGFGNGTTCGTALETIPTQGAYRMDAWSLTGNGYFAFTNATKDGNTTFNIPSNIYKYMGTGTNCPAGGGFGDTVTRQCGVPYQSLSTSGAYDFKYFTIGSDSYLGVANSYDGANFNINSKIYKWMTSGTGCPATGGFGDGTTCGAAFQLIPTQGATQLNILNVAAVPYLVVANAFNGVTYNVSSNIYAWMSANSCFGNGVSCGVALQVLPTSGASWWEPVVVNGNNYLAVADYYNGSSRNINSTIMQWAPNGCGDAQLGTPTVWTGDQGPANGNPTGIFTGARLYTLTCRWLDNSLASSTNVNVVVQPQLILSANGSTTPTVYITPNTSALIQWTTENVQQGSCSVSNSKDSTVWTADSNTAGYPSPVLQDGQSISYTINCIDLLSQPATYTMTVTAAAVLPSVSNGDMVLTASRALKGGRPTLTWNVVNLKAGISCTITPTLAGGAAASNWDGTGTSWSSPAGGALGPTINVATLFTLTCSNKAGDTVAVTAIAALIPAFKEL